MADPYLDSNGVLRNKAGITDHDELAAYEAEIAAIEEAALLDSPPGGAFNFNLLLKLHERLFGEVYAWAGKPRITTLAKQSYEGSSSGVTAFAPPVRITTEATKLYAALPSIESLASLSASEFAHKTAPFFVKLNNIHPFREGNGRTQRLYFRLLARACGHELAWDVVTRERMIAVSISGARDDDTPMVRLFQEISDDRRVGVLRNGLDFLRSSAAVRWNDLYIATTTAGQTYAGRLVGIAGSDFMMRVENEVQSWIAIGDKRDVPERTAPGDTLEIKTKFW